MDPASLHPRIVVSLGRSTVRVTRINKRHTARGLDSSVSRAEVVHEFAQGQGTLYTSENVTDATRAATLTDRSYWDDYWNSFSLPRECTRQPRSFYLNAILDVFDRHLPRNPNLSIAEVGGAPGQYLAYMYKHFGYHVTCVDYSATGCRRTAENFRLLGIPGEVIEADIFADDPTLPQFDVVYSLGLIEHFADRTPIVERHVRLLKPGGYLVLGVPNFRGVNGWFMRSLGPDVYAAHDIEAMDLDGWRTFEERLGLETVFKAYVGGFEPSIFKRREQKRLGNLVPYLIAYGLFRLLHRHFGFLRRFNNSNLSGYAMAVYRLGAN
jgi:SAM-dependent methyltransferase